VPTNTQSEFLIGKSRCHKTTQASSAKSTLLGGIDGALIGSLTRSDSSLLARTAPPCPVALDLAMS
jgi:hypothetical protein